MQDPHLTDDDSGYSQHSDRSTFSLTSSIFEYERSYGRSYHSFRRGIYVLPNDEAEQQRLDIHHRCMRMLLSNRYWLAPILPVHVLDVGTGTGSWAIEVADATPSAHVVGIDLSPIQPNFVPPNVEFEIMDAEQDWEGFSERFDLVHTQFMNGVSIKDWTGFFEKTFAALQPGGWVESHEIDALFCCEDSDIPTTCAYVRWAELWNKGLQALGTTGRCYPEQMKAHMTENGFINIKLEVHQMPVGPCIRDDRDPQHRGIGPLNLVGIVDGIGGLSLKVFLEGLHWSRIELEHFLMEVRKELQESKLPLYIPV